MSSSVAELIRERVDAMPAGERRAAHALVADYPVLGLKTVADFSARAGVSSPTILRFVARLGYGNYAEFQTALQDELAAQLQSPMARASVVSPPPGEHSDMLLAAIDNLGETFRNFSDNQARAVIEVLAPPKARIYLVGGRFTDPVAQYMATHLAIVRPGVVHLAGQEGNWRDRLIDMGKGDVLVVFDIRRYQDSLFALAQKAHARGVVIVLFTDQWLSPIARLAKHVVAGRTAVPSPWDSSASLLVVAEALVAGLTRRLNEQSAARIREMEQLRGGNSQA